MDLVSLKLKKFETALVSFEAVVKKDLNDEFFRDSAIQRFEYTIELFWKTLKVMLNESGISVKSPREVIKESCGMGVLSDEESEMVLKMLRLRNETSHDYAIEIARELSPKLPTFAELLRNVFEKMKVLENSTEK